MFPVILMGLLSFQLPSEAEILNFKIVLLTIPVSDGKIAVAPRPRDSGWKIFLVILKTY
jgi:hypothetical protein